MTKILIICLYLITFNANAFDRYTIADVVSKIQPTVVTIKAEQEKNNKDLSVNPFVNNSKTNLTENSNSDLNSDKKIKSKKQYNIGSGVLISADGLLITNYHVVELADKITITNMHNNFYDAKVIGFDQKSDLALLQISSDKNNFDFINFADSNNIRIGELVIAIGNPYGLDGSVSTGIISARNRNVGTNIYDDFLQTDASINPGNSGGPLFNLDGDVIGINTAIFSKNGGSNGIGFAIPANTVQLIIKQLQTNGKVVRGWLGIQAQALDVTLAQKLKLDSTNGVLVDEVSLNSPAQIANIQTGDIILQYNDKQIISLFDLPKMVAETPINSQVNIVVLRNGNKLNLTAKIVALDDIAQNYITSNNLKNNDSNKILDGFYVEQKNDTSNVVINQVEPSFKQYNLQKNDIILQVAQQNIESIQQLKNIVDNAKVKSLLFLINRNGQTIFSVVDK
jgi:serine protease Do